MKIKEVEALGFKSFGEKTTLSFPPGITAIVGPNGCGKSNVMDAIRWAMGEQSAKQLRGTLMEDIIFNGSEEKKPVGIAEVSLIFSNDNGMVKPEYKDFSEIQVTRRLFRSGESEYSINRVPCRLKDITELFMDTGVGTKAYSMVEQGKVERIINSKPQDRRFLIEEAAGITKYKSRKKEALGKIESTKRNLVRLSDIIGEISRQLNSLKRQAKKAERYNSITKEVRETEIAFSLNDYKKLLKEKEEKRCHREALLATKVGIVSKIQISENQLEGTKIRLLDLEKEVNETQERLFSINNSIQRDESKIEYGNKDLERLQKQRIRVEEERKRFGSQLEATIREIQELKKKKENIYSILVSEESKLVEREEQFQRLEEYYEASAERIETEKADLVEFLTEAANLKNSVTYLEDQEKDFIERERKSRGDLLNVKESIKELEEKESVLDKELEELEESRDGLRDEKAKKFEEMEALQHVAEEKRKIIEDLRGEFNEKSARLRSLKELQKNLDGFGEGVRSVMVNHKRNHPEHNGIYGIVADVIETAPEYETALEAIMGEKLQSIIVQSQKQGVEAIEYLKTQSAGRSSFIPLNLRECKGSSCQVPSSNTKFTYLKDLVEIEEDFHNIADYLLSKVLIVEDLRKALEFWDGNRFDGTLVTLDGDVIDSHGVLTGGSRDTVSAGILQKKREIKDLVKVTNKIRKECAKVEDDHRQIKESISSTQKHMEELGTQLYALDVRGLALENELSQVRSESGRLTERTEILSFEREQLLVEVEKIQSNLLETQKKLEETSHFREEKERFIENLQEEEKKRRDEVDQLRDYLTDSKVRIGSLKERLEAASLQLKRMKEIEVRIDRDIKNKERETQGIKGDYIEIIEKIENSRTDLEELLEVHKEFQASLVVKKAELEDKIELVQQEEKAYKTLRNEQEEIDGELNDLNLQITEINLCISHLEEKIEEKYKVKLHSISCDYKDSFTREDMNDRLCELKESLERMGDVNLTAIGEYEELKDRYEFLINQQEDLTQSLESLQTAINKINRITKSKFHETFIAVNKKFKEIFPCLFNGGRAGLMLTDADDLLETGIDIVAQPPGKKLQNINLLSGGEKTLTTIALIFSIFSIKPSPFCLLDEIDAALDDLNIGRYTELLTEMSEDSQFIIITHNKRTMEVADTLIGVTMEDPGVSKLISVKMN
ncbi:MAG: chromosome segregation protein SMC [Thermodesulfobacteriota bacterium]|nr:chromosome segregation protein SMC [Thermodesulfobacteriota bacterium]